ncbi:hypothetical protein HDE68_003956 [Pedobacter cryoconitis]|uniref:Uncharacterized protein n=1 Tax=Pedobacter cryoconitis TaxID=188932 RepID=A0A7W8ZQB4_9SPHI|nr:hypothetical protein [Pedobacter cryoconitis]
MCMLMINNSLYEYVFIVVNYKVNKSKVNLICFLENR